MSLETLERSVNIDNLRKVEVGRSEVSECFGRGVNPRWESKNTFSSAVANEGRRNILDHGVASDN